MVLSHCAARCVRALPFSAPAPRGQAVYGDAKALVRGLAVFGAMVFSVQRCAASWSSSAWSVSGVPWTGRTVDLPTDSVSCRTLP